ncbi:protein adenylyltransferase SelO [Alkalicoccus halolimnae]|uniref:Protein nucleotidyltransferase YdiU n=1 Tax=Alkalicoccus halolimnae TaxID=1667239 RepID=A0A5C7FDF8_9BACI|nr:YdiU family protein [Alkalicoccus halolimnae]TXF83247.1 YdiU family protein [Alkalicoccus halolimnae]
MSIRNEQIQPGWNLEHSYTALPEKFFRKIELNPVHSPKMILLNRELASSLGLDPDELQSEKGASILAGNELPAGSLPLAQAYAGHQFGNFTMLGDGRALLIGEQITPFGKRVDIQLKGSGRTPYSRGGDGRASLGPMLREYIISEAMYALGIPTNRSLSVVRTGESVIRETKQPGAVLTRTAASHLRVGTFQFALGGGTEEDVKALADYALERHFPGADRAENRYLFLLKEVIRRQAELIADWQLVGFIHGVMNTDNMAISGETIDYGPCAFMNSYDPNTVFSSIDVQGRYSYGNQPRIAGWNLARFAETLVPLIDEDQEKAVELAQAELSSYLDLYHQNWLHGMRKKLGLSLEVEKDESLFNDLLDLMQEYEADYTNTFRALTFQKCEELPFSDTVKFMDWKARWKERLQTEQKSEKEVQEMMQSHNPAVIPRNHRVEEALEAAVQRGDYSVVKKLINVLADPYAHTPEQEAYCSPPPESSGPYQTYCGT